MKLNLLTQAVTTQSVTGSGLNCQF